MNNRPIATIRDLLVKNKLNNPIWLSKLNRLKHLPCSDSPAGMSLWYLSRSP
ncbi:hypothetical protein ABVN80_21335 [Acinetobacter baumannii]